MTRSPDRRPLAAGPRWPRRGVALALAPLLLVACAQDRGMTGATPSALTEAERGKVVAKIGDATITLEEFERRLNQQSPFSRSRYNSLTRKKEFLESLVRFELLAMEAKANGHDKDPDVVLAHKQAMVRLLTANEVANLVKIDDISDADIAAYFAEHRADFIKPAEVRAAHILMPDETSARGLITDLQAALALAGDGGVAAFAQRARQASTDAKTAEQGGDLGWFGEPGVSKVSRSPNAPVVPPAVAKAAFALATVGAVHPEPIRSSQGWHVVQRTGHRQAIERSLDEVRTRIRNTLFRSRKAEALEAYVQGLRAKAGVQIDDAVLGTAKVAPAGEFNPKLAPPHLRPAPLGPPGGPAPAAPAAPGDAP